jgi:ketosteroid isomerase-like protein
LTHPHAALIARFYDAFQRRDAAAMAACYHRDVHFTDEVFPDLRGPQAGAMWAMLCARGKDLRVEPSAITADDAQGRARWDAWYTFSGSGRPVHNIIQAEFGFRDGLIVRHVDRFDFQRWARQALGVSGLVLGGTRFMRRKVQSTAARSLAAWMAAPR